MREPEGRLPEDSGPGTHLGCMRCLRGSPRRWHVPSAPRSLPSLGPWLPPHCYRPPIMQITQAHSLPRETSEPRENTAITSTACPALPGGGVPASWAGPSGTFSYRCLSAGTHLWSRCACSGTSEGTNIPFDLAICFCLCNASWRTFSSARKGRSLSKHCIALYSRGLRPPGSRLPPVQGLLGTRWHSRR